MANWQAPMNLEPEDQDELMDSPELDGWAKIKGALNPKPAVPAAPAMPPDAEVQDKLAAMASAPKAAPSPDLSALLPTRQDLQDAADKKRNIALMGGLTNTLANQQGWGNFYTGHMAPKQDVSGTTKAMEDAADQPVLQKQAMLKTAMEKPVLARFQAMQDPNSDETKMARATAGALIESVKTSGVFKKSKALAALQSLAQNGTGYQIHSMLESNPLLKDIATQAMADKKNEFMVNRMIAQMGNKNQLAAQGTVNHDKILSTYVPRLDGAAKLMDLMDGAEKGEFKTNRAFLGQLNAEVSRLETGSQSPGLHSAEKTEMESSAANLKALRDKILGGVSDVEMAPIIQQTRGMASNLANSYMQQIDDRMESLKAGALPDQVDVFNSKHNQMKHDYGKRFGSWSHAGQPSSVAAGGKTPDAVGAAWHQGVGEGSANASTPAPHPQDSAAVTWAKSNRADPRAKRILELNGAN